MAQAHRILNLWQVANWILPQMKFADECLVGTWGVRTWAPQNTPVKSILSQLPKGTQMLVGFGSFAEAMRASGILRHYPNIEARYTQESHAKYVISRRARQWVGVLGSANLSDSAQFNIMVQVGGLYCREIQEQHRALWHRALTYEGVKLRSLDVAPILAEPLYQANDTREQLRG